MFCNIPVQNTGRAKEKDDDVVRDSRVFHNCVSKINLTKTDRPLPDITVT